MPDDSTDRTRWLDLNPEPGLAAALDHAGPRPPDDADQNRKRRWSELFANGCAVALADLLRRETDLRRKRIRPDDLESGTEPLTPLGAGTSKRIDVTVVDPILGLELGFSLKGFNFKDATSGNYDKNLTGRLYELGDEVRLVHEHLPHAFMVGVLFLPLDATTDKITGASSFANAVRKLRQRTGRLDPQLAGQSSRCDAGYVGLYSLGNESEGPSRGAVRFLDVQRPPPRRGRPTIPTTLAMSQVVSEAVASAAQRDTVEWGPAEDSTSPGGG